MQTALGVHENVLFADGMYTLLKYERDCSAYRNQAKLSGSLQFIRRLKACL